MTIENPPHLRHHGLWLYLGWLMLVTIFTLSMLPERRLPNAIAGQATPPLALKVAQRILPGRVMPYLHSIGDKLRHVEAFTVLMLWFGQLYRRRFKVFASLCAYGLAIEVSQYLFTNRMFELGDLAANMVGLVLGSLLLLTPLSRSIGWVDRRLFSKTSVEGRIGVGVPENRKGS